MFTEKNDAAVMEAGGAEAHPSNAVPPPLRRPRSFTRPAAVAGRYGERRGIDPVAAALVIALHVALIAALLHARTVYVKKKEAELALVNLTPPPEPPEAKPETPPAPAKTPVVSPVPVVQVPSPPTVFASPDPVPAPPSPAPPVPAPVFAPPAPPQTINAGDLSAQMISGRPPRYPIESRRRREQGTVVLQLTVGTDGRVESIEVSRSSGHARLDDAARDAVRGWRWRPIQRDGRTVKVRGIVEIPFVLKG